MGIFLKEILQKKSVNCVKFKPIKMDNYLYNKMQENHADEFLWEYKTKIQSGKF